MGVKAYIQSAQVRVGGPLSQNYYYSYQCCELLEIVFFEAARMEGMGAQLDFQESARPSRRQRSYRILLQVPRPCRLEGGTDAALRQQLSLVFPAKLFKTCL